MRMECLADALDNGIEFGVWGGMTERERRALLRRRPDVSSFGGLLQRARKAYELEHNGEFDVDAAVETAELPAMLRAGNMR